MRNDPFVHDTREALIEFQRQSRPSTFPTWLCGFFASFVRDYDKMEFSELEGNQNIYNQPFEQRKICFELGFQAGLALRNAVEEHQKEYPKESTTSVFVD
jgi:hypothetical protein